MTMDTLEARTNDGIGHAENAAGAAVDDSAAKVKQFARTVDAKVQDAAESAKETIGKVADQVRGGVSKATDQASDTYADLVSRAGQLADRVDPMVKEKPYMVLGVAAAVGVLIGMLFSGGGSKVIYVKPRA